MAEKGCVGRDFTVRIRERIPKSDGEAFVRLVHHERLEHSDNSSGIMAARNRRAESATTDADLANLIDAWPTLDDSTKSAILAMVRAAHDAGGGQ